MKVSVVRLLAISFVAAAALPMASAEAQWREGYDGGGYYVPAPPRMIYREDGYRRDYDVRPWARRQAYAPDYYDEPGYYDEDPGYDVAPVPRPQPRRLSREVAAEPRSLTPAKPRRAVPAIAVPPRKPEQGKATVAMAEPAKPAPFVIHKALPVPRPNLESMDF